MKHYTSLRSPWWLLVVAPMVLSVLTTGCQTWWQERMAARQPGKRQQPSPPLPQFTGLQPEEAAFTGTMETPDTARTGEARDQVLAFINRLQTVGDPGLSNPSGANAGRTDPTRKIDGAQEPRPDQSQRPAHPKQAVSPVTAPASPSTPPTTGQVTRDESPQQVRGAAQPPATRPRILDVSIRQPSRVQPAPQPHPDEPEQDLHTQLANRPVITGQADDGPGEVDAIIDGLKKRLADAPNDVDARWRLTLLGMALDKEDRIAAVSTEMSQESASIWKHAVNTMTASRRLLEDPVNGAQAAMTAIDALRNEVRTRVDLSIPTVALCSRVQAFGVYEELAETAFRANRTNQAIVYFEIKHFTSEQTSEGRFRTLLTDRFEVLTPDGDLLWHHEEPSIEDISRTRREDFFVAQRITLPPTLGAGRYVLKITVQDVLAAKGTQAIHEFSVGSN